MSYHAELAPRRKPWLIALPLAIVIALGVAWTALWFYAAAEAETRLNEWQAQQAKGGRTFTCGSRSVGGYPFRIEVRCADAAAELKDTQPPLAIRLKEILAVAQVWDPKLILAEFSGPLTAGDIGGAPYLTARFGLAQASLRGTPATPERASVVINGLRLEGAQAGQMLFEATHAEFHARVQYGSWPHNPAIDLSVKLAAAAAPAVHVLAAQPFDADILAVLHGMKDLSPKPLPVRLREWQAAGGKLEIQNARLAQAEALANSTGMLALTPQGRLDGTLKVTVSGIERLMPALLPGQAPPALSAIERAVPGIAQRIAPQQQQSLQAGLLALLGQPAEIEGKKGIAIQVVFKDGRAMLGPIPLGQVPAAF
jgi:hypothetical protein